MKRVNLQRLYMCWKSRPARDQYILATCNVSDSCHFWAWTGDAAVAKQRLPASAGQCAVCI